MSSFKFNKIAIVESLNCDDKKTGQDIAHDLNLLEIFHNKGIIIECKQISQKQELVEYINSLTEDAKKKGIFPILQIEAHGSEDKQNLVLNSGNPQDIISWDEFSSIIRDLNIASKCNLLIVMATCFGAFLTSSVSILKPAPFWGVIGSATSVSPSQILSSMTKFYTELFNGSNSQILLAGLKTHPTISELKFITSEWLFVKAYKFYIQEYCNEPTLDLRAKRVITKNIIKGVKSVPNVELVKSKLSLEGKSKFESLLKNFFMVDIYPENVNKISVEYEKLDR